MIPVKLKLSNFTSYGEIVPELDFSHFHLAAISGENGAGKSSLLDAITWCLWGTSRLGDNSDSLIRLGQTQMVVEFAFELDGHDLTVKRTRSSKSGGSTSLELFSNSSTKGGLAHNLTEGTIKATQAKIIETLHLSFETFTNSAFLRQGHADEFTTKGPTDRKRILADILGLGHYDLLEEKAKEKAKEAQTKLQLFEYQLLEIEAELSQKQAREKALTQAEEEAQTADKQLEEVEKSIKLVEAERELVKTKLKSLEEAQERIILAQKELTELKLQVSLKETAQTENKTILDQKEVIEKNYAQLQVLNDKRKALEVKRTELIKVKDELVEIQKIISQRDFKRNKAITDLEVEKKQLETKNQQLTEQNQQLKSDKSSCPTCGQSIGITKNQEIIKKNQIEIDKNQLVISEIKTKITQFTGYTFPESKQAAEKESQIKILEDQTQDYKQISEGINERAKYENLYLKLSSAQTAVKTNEEAILDLKKIIQARQESIDKESKSLEEFSQLQTKLTEVMQRLTAEETVKQELAQKAKELRGQVGAAKELVSRATQLEKLLDDKKVEKGKLTTEKEAFEELSLAFGKKGIQAMIIESAIPELEDETNRLLDKLSAGRMRVSFQTQRETKGKIAGTGEKGVVETLDIIISDEMGERPYEAYSGGEQFRVNFAIRLALSKLLTHRAGAKLQFLVIDEGFGTQDAQGRSRIVEALDAIKDDFEKIIVITHLEELKEEFPTRIEVQKTPSGSTFEVVGI